MYKLLTPTKDASIYSNEPNVNTGLDEILEISKTSATSIARTLLFFDLDGVENVENSVLLLKETEPTEIGVDYTIFAYPISGSWEMGIGRKFQDTIYDFGVTWDLKGSNIQWETEGGDFYTSSFASQSFSYESADIQMDVSNVIEEMISGNIPNDGLLLMGDEEIGNIGTFKFFSKETHTIHQPKLRLGWDDQVFETGSLLPLNDDSKISVKLNDTYERDIDYTIRIYGTTKYPIKQYDSNFGYNIYQYLPQTSYYEIIDYVSKDVIIPFSEFSKISCDEKSNYININFSGWETGRVYELIVRMDLVNHSKLYKNKFIFKVVD